MSNAAAGFHDDQTAETWQKQEGDGSCRVQPGDLNSKKAVKDGHGDGLDRAVHGDLSSNKAMEEGHGDGLHRAEHGDLRSKKAMEEGCGDGLHRAEHGDLTSKKAMEEGHGDGLHRAEHGDLSSNKAMEEGHGDGLHRDDLKSNKAMEEGLGDGLHRAEHGDLSSKKAMEERHGDSLHRAKHGDLSSKKPMEEGHGDGLHRAQHGGRRIKMAVEEGHGDGKAGTVISHGEMECRESTSPQPETPIYVQAPHKSMSSSSVSHVHASLAAHDAPGKHRHENVVAPDESGDNANENMAARARSREHSYAAYGTCGERGLENVASHGTLGEHIRESEVVYSTPGGDAHETTSADDTSGHHSHGNIFPNVDLYATKGQSGTYPYETMSANGNVGGYAQGRASPDSPTPDAYVKGDTLKAEPARFPYEDSFESGDVRGNMYDNTSTNNEFGANAHEKLTAYKEAKGDDVKVDLNYSVSNTEAPSLKNISTKSGSLLSGSSYYTKQSVLMKNLGLMLRFGVAIFSLIAFSVMISTNEKRVAAGSTFYVKFSDYQAYNYLAALNLLSFLYSSGQLVLLAQSRTTSILSSPVKWGASVYLCDQMLAFLMLSSSSSAATASELSRHGLRNIWPPACSTWKLSLFCSKADVAVAMSFVSSLCMVLSSFLSGYHLSNLLAE